MKDPIDHLKNLSLQESIITEEEFAEIDLEIEATIAEAVKFAEESPEPDLDSIYTNIYA